MLLKLYNKQQNYLKHIVLYSILLISAYSNTLNVPWVLDDIPNIVDNIYLHINNLSTNSLYNSLYSNPQNPFELNSKMYRPVACLSFALNWYFGKNNVFGYHIVNIVIHTIATFFLFLFILNLFQTPKLSSMIIRTEEHLFEGNRDKEHSNLIFYTTLFSAFLWATNPIQTQAVTYIVQRMASMSAMFYIMGMWGYLKGRLNKPISKQIIWYLYCFICFILSVSSKENGIMMPISIFIIEILFFYNLSDKKNIKRLFIATLILLVILFCLGTFLFFYKSNISILNYDYRTFSLKERILTQPRVVIFYLSQIFFPLPDRFSVAHDFVLSSSIFTPWTTIPSILFIFILIGFGIYEIKPNPLLSFSILFFFLNHIIESTVIPLEIVFEHRNYLPSMFLFLPITLSICQLLNKYKSGENKIKSALVFFLLITSVIAFSCSTYIRNKVWSDEITLWSDAYKKAPNNARAANILAIKLAWGDNSKHPKRYDMAIELFKKSLKMDMPSITVKSDILGNIGLIYSNNKNDYNKAIKFFRQALLINPNSLKIRRDMVISTLILMGNYEEALNNIEILISKDSNNWLHHNLKGFVLLWQGKYDDAMPNFKTAINILKRENNNLLSAVLFNMGVNLSLNGEHHLAYEILEEMLKQEPNNLSIYFAIIENSLRANNKNRAIKYASQMMGMFDKKTILEQVDLLTNNRTTAPISRKIVEPFILELK